MVARTQQSALLSPVVHKEHRSLRTLFDERAGGRQQRHTHRAVVVRAGPDGITINGIPHPIMILVGAEEHVFLTQDPIRALNATHDIHRRRLKSLQAQLHRHGSTTTQHRLGVGPNQKCRSGCVAAGRWQLRPTRLIGEALGRTIHIVGTTSTHNRQIIEGPIRLGVGHNKQRRGAAARKPLLRGGQPRLGVAHPR